MDALQSKVLTPSSPHVLNGVGADSPDIEWSWGCSPGSTVVFCELNGDQDINRRPQATRRASGCWDEVLNSRFLVLLTLVFDRFPMSTSHKEISVLGDFSYSSQSTAISGKVVKVLIFLNEQNDFLLN